MQEILTIIFLTTASGSCIPIGGIAATMENIRPNWMNKEFRHSLIAFGGGILLGAVTFVLVPEGVSSMQDSLLAIPIVLIGGLSFLLLNDFLVCIEERRHN